MNARTFVQRLNMISYPQSVINWILAQPSTGGWTIQEWHDHYQSFDKEAWSKYYSEKVSLAGKKYEPEEWAEHMESPSFRVGHPIIGTLMELGEQKMIDILEGARAVNQRSDRRRRVEQRYSPY